MWGLSPASARRGMPRTATRKDWRICAVGKGESGGGVVWYVVCRSKQRAEFAEGTDVTRDDAMEVQSLSGTRVRFQEAAEGAVKVQWCCLEKTCCKSMYKE